MDFKLSNFFLKNGVSLEVLNVVLKMVYQIKGTCSVKIDFFYLVLDDNSS